MTITLQISHLWILVSGSILMIFHTTAPPRAVQHVSSTRPRSRPQPRNLLVPWNRISTDYSSAYSRNKGWVNKTTDSWYFKSDSLKDHSRAQEYWLNPHVICTARIRLLIITCATTQVARNQYNRQPSANFSISLPHANFLCLDYILSRHCLLASRILPAWRSRSKTASSFITSRNGQTSTSWCGHRTSSCRIQAHAQALCCGSNYPALYRVNTL